MGWQTLRLRTRILLGYGLILALTTLLALLLIVRATTLNQRITQLNDAVARETTLGVQLDGQVASTQQAIDRYLQQPQPDNLRTANESLRRLADKLAAARAGEHSPQQRRRLDDLATQMTLYQKSFQTLSALIDSQATLAGDLNQHLFDASMTLNTAITKYLNRGAPDQSTLSAFVRAQASLQLAGLWSGRLINEQSERLGQNALDELAVADTNLKLRRDGLESATKTALDTALDDTTLVRIMVSQYMTTLPQVRELRHTLLNDQGAALKDQAGEISRAALDQLAGATTDLELQSRQTQQLTLGALAITLVLAAFFGLQLARTITRPMADLAAATSRLGEGDYTATVATRDRGELGQLAAAFNHMTYTLAQQRAAVLAQQQALAEQNQHLEQALIQLREAKTQAEESNRAKSAFLAQMSHELRTPLNGILGYAQILKRQGLDADMTSGLSIIEQSGQHLLTLINDILDLAKIEAGRLELNSTAVQLPRFLDGIVGIIRARAEAKQLRLAFEAPPSLPVWVWADETRLRQILLNLLGNAVKFTDHGSVTLRVEIRDWRLEIAQSPISNLQSPFSILRFEVEDTGTGIAPDQLERIFQPFEQVGERTRKVEGNGLGLAITRQLVQFMGGDLSVASEEGRGSTFWFAVPLSLVEATMWTAPARERLITGYTGRRRTVLVVDDIPSNRAVLIDMLSPLGFNVLEAADGRQAVDLAQQARPDLILMDRRMPVLSGSEAVQQIHALPNLRAIPIIATSASVTESDQTTSREVGYDAFLPKPIAWLRLMALLDQHLRLEWVYAAEGEAAELPAALVPPPPEELAMLCELAANGDIQALQERAAQLEQRDPLWRPFAHKLGQLASRFELDRLQVLLSEYRSAES